MVARALLALLLGFGVPAVAHAGTLTYTPSTLRPPDCAVKCGSGSGSPESLVYVGGPGERNDVLLEPGAEGSTVVRDTAGITIGPGDSRCVLLDAQTANCGRPLDGVGLGDGDDVLLDRLGIVVDGGPGDDLLSTTSLRGRLTGGPGDDALVGGPGGDLLTPGAGTDRVHGGAGDDRVLISDADDGRDTVDGGDGTDVADHRETLRGIVVDVADPSRSRDTFTGIETIIGTGRADVIRGGPAAETLDGFVGADVLDGRGGDDRIVVPGGRAFGGDGDDLLDMRLDHEVVLGADYREVEGAPDTAFVDAGPGNDRVLKLNLAAVVRCGPGDDESRASVVQDAPGLRGASCERGTGVVELFRRGRGKLRVQRGCPGRDVGVTACTVTVRVSDLAGRRLVTATHRTDGKLDDLAAPVELLRLPRALRRRVARGAHPRIRIVHERRTTVAGVIATERAVRVLRLTRQDLGPIPDCDGCP